MVDIIRVPRTSRCPKKRKKGIFYQKKRRKKGIFGVNKGRKKDPFGQFFVDRSEARQRRAARPQGCATEGGLGVSPPENF